MAYKGINVGRIYREPMEKRFADEWEHQMEYGHTLDYLLTERPNEPGFPYPSERDEVVAATITQWLGSQVGLSFISHALGFDVREHIPKEFLE